MPGPAPSDPQSTVTGADPVDPRRTALVALLDGHRPVDAREARSLAVVRDALATPGDPFDRHAGLTHVTASGVVVGRRGVLLHRHRRLHRWMQPGGHLDPAERPEDAVLRECVEETGLVAAHPSTGPCLVHVDVHEAADAHVHLDLRYLVVGPDADPAPPPGESQEVGWFDWPEAVALADDALAGALRSARRLIDAGTVDVPGATAEEADG